MTDTPDLWWSPTVGVIQKLNNGWKAFGGGTQRWLGVITAEPFPADAVQVAGPRPDLVEKYRAYVGHVVEIYIEQRELLRWLHAEQAWQLTEMRLDVEKYRDYLKMANRTTERRGQERDALQAQLARVGALAADWEANPAVDWTAGDAAEHLRAALQGDQPAGPGLPEVDLIAAEPDVTPVTDRCCFGPLVNGAHAMNCRQRCQDCQGDPSGPFRCRCRDTPTEPDVTPPDPSGRITNGGPVVPFTATDLADLTPTTEEVISGD